MSISFFPILTALVMAVLFLTIPVIIGVYVWRDARRRGMNALLWTAVAVLVPALIGFVVYLLVRANYSNLQCAACSTRVSEAYVVCPGCGTKLRASCPTCAMAVEPGWKVCPKCAADLPQSHAGIVAPVRPKDKALGKIFAAVIIVPLLLLAILLASMASSFSGGSSSMKEESFEAYAENQEDAQVRDQVLSWAEDKLGNLGHAYALRYDSVTDAGNESFYLVVVPGADAQGKTSFGQTSSIFGTKLEVELEQGAGEDALFSLVSSADEPPRLVITLDGKRIPCDITVVDFNPTTYRIVPSHVPVIVPETSESDAEVDLVGVSEAVEVDVLGGIVARASNTYGGFHGDGVAFAEIHYADDRVLGEIEQSAHWKRLPLSDAVEALAYGVTTEENGVSTSVGPYLTEDGEPLFPQVQNGYYYFRDRHDQASDPSDASQTLDRASVNVTLAIYDADSRTLYYCEFDS